ncbi:MAG: hypothetical protein ACKO5M_05680, partial [Vulcanococcus sp.]
ALNERLDVLSEAWNEAEIARPSLGRWLAQFDAPDQPIALRLLECMQMHGWARLIRECRLLHQRLCIDLAEDGFEDFSVYPRESQVGLPADLLDYDIDNPEPVTLHHPRS